MDEKTKKESYAKSIVATIKYCYPQIYSKDKDNNVFNPSYIAKYIEIPKDHTKGDYALPVFRFSRTLNEQNPQVLAKKIAEASGNYLSNATATAEGIFINIKSDISERTKEVITKILKEENEYGKSTQKNKPRVLIEYSSVNIAKPFGIAHLRTTILGDSLGNIYEKLGFDVVRLNYLGDWGTQFGKLIVAYRKWFSENNNIRDAIKLLRTLENDCDNIIKLFELYVRFHLEAKNNPSLEDEARKVFRALEDGDIKTKEIWKKFREISLNYYKRIYRLIEIQFDESSYIGESELNDRMNPIIDRFKKAGLTSISDGALIVDLNDPQLPPCLLKKGDGATLYATRDIAGAFWRMEKFNYQKSIYVVANSQSDHFKQVFKAIALLEEAENIPEENRVSNKVEHVDFGWVKFGDEVMSTRAGNVINLEDVINKAVDLVKEKIKEKNPNLKAIDETAKMVGLGAVKFSQLSVKRQKDINFNWDAVLSFEGETGPYLQYTHARLCSLIHNYGQSKIDSSINFALLVQENSEEQRIIKLLEDFVKSIKDAFNNNDPYFVAIHLLKLAGAFNKFYQRKTGDGLVDKIISDDEELTKARMALVKSVQIVIKDGLGLLGIRAPEEM